MRSYKSTLTCGAVFVPCAVLAAFVLGCEGSGSGYRSPTAPPVPTPTSQAYGSYVGEMTVVSVTGSGPCFSFQPGESVWGAYWGLGLDGDSFYLDFELGNHWYTGTLQGRNFGATYIPSAAHTHPCDYSSTISGAFAQDFSPF